MWREYPMEKAKVYFTDFRTSSDENLLLAIRSLRRRTSYSYAEAQMPIG